MAHVKIICKGGRWVRVPAAVLLSQSHSETGAALRDAVGRAVEHSRQGGEGEADLSLPQDSADDWAVLAGLLASADGSTEGLTVVSTHIVSIFRCPHTANGTRPGVQHAFLSLRQCVCDSVCMYVQDNSAAVACLADKYGFMGCKSKIEAYMVRRDTCCLAYCWPDTLAVTCVSQTTSQPAKSHLMLCTCPCMPCCTGFAGSHSCCPCTDH